MTFQFSPNPSPGLRRFTVSEYHRLISSGLFRHDEQFELIDGLITQKMSRNPPHDAALNRTRRSLEKSLPAGFITRIQSAITLATSEPEPDIVIAVGSDDDYQSKHPSAADAFLVVEVSDTSLEFDRTVKLSMYARAGVKRYWIVNTIQKQVEQYPDLSVNSTTPLIALPGDTIELSFPNGPVRLSVSDFFSTP